jgi:hypothetical protein
MRRRTVIASVVAAGAAVTAGLYRFTDLFVKHYPPTPYDDVLSRLSDRDPAIRFGAAVRGAPDTPALAARLRAMPADVTAAAGADIAANRLAEVDGWLVPESVMLLAALAARTAVAKT